MTEIAFVLSWPAASSLRGVLLAVSEEPDDVLTARLGVTGADLDGLFDDLVALARDSSEDSRIVVPGLHATALRRLFSVAFERISEPELSTLTGREMWELHAAEKELLAALDAALP